MIGYHEMRKLSPEKARELVRIISKTAKILGISRKPKSSPNKTPPNFEYLIVKEAKRTGFRYRKIKGFFERKYSLSFSENTIKAILKRNEISKEKGKSQEDIFMIMKFLSLSENFSLILNIFMTKLLFLLMYMST